jgi:hypothetical protein
LAVLDTEVVAELEIVVVSNVVTVDVAVNEPLEIAVDDTVKVP